MAEQLYLASGGAVGQSLYSSSATAAHTPGTLAYSVVGGRKFRYVKCGATALVVGNCIQAPAEKTNHDQLTPSAAAIGAEQITVTLGATAVTANQYAGGQAVIDTTPGEGYAYTIKGHPAADASATVVLTLETPIIVALTTSSRVTIAPNPYNLVIQHPVTTATGVALGGAVFIIVANEYGWIQSGGPGAALIAGTPGVGQPVTSVGAVAGALSVHSAELNSVATMMVTGVDAKILPVMWEID